MCKRGEKEEVIIPAEKNPIELNLLTYYGVSIAEYRGEGVLTLKDGKPINCKFEAGQLTSGNVLLLCKFKSHNYSPASIPVCRFKGTTTKGFPIFAKHITEVNYLPDYSMNCLGEWAAFHLGEMSVQMTNDADGATKAHFGVTNFEFAGTKRHCTDNFSYLILPLSLEYTGSATELSIVPLRRYDSIMKRIKTLKGIDVTCEAIGNIPRDEGIASLTESIGNLCYLLSVARGTKVQWIYRDLYDGAGELIQRTHYSRITKPFCPLPIIDPRAKGSDETKAFIEQTYPIYLEKKETWRLNRGTIDAYLDAKAEHDYLQMRGVKLAVAMEKLKSVFLELPDSPVKEYVVDEKDFRECLAPLISKEVRHVLMSMNVEQRYRDAISDTKKIEGLNRRSFSHLLSKLCKYIGLGVKRTDMNLFITCRNSLVHNGRFCCKSLNPEERQKCRELTSPLDEYFFLVNFLDRVFLKLLGYSGLYMNWRLPWPPRKEGV